MEGTGNGCSQPEKLRVAVVTGGNKGIAFEICRQLASNGVAVVLTARDEKRGAEAADALRGLGLSDVVFYQVEVGDPSSALRLADFLRDKYGRLDLVNNAAVSSAAVKLGHPATLQQEVGRFLPLILQY